jgi:hypothetical protein
MGKERSRNNCCALAALGLLLAGNVAWAETKAPAALKAPDAFASASPDARRVADWIAGSRDNSNLPYLVIDKANARAFAFDATGKLQGSAPVLLGMARGDRLLTANETAVDDIPEDERITPAGRYLSRLALDSHGKELLVIDYAASISLHPVVTNKPEERRVERLKTATPQDNRISHGCINVPADFYRTVVSPAFTHTKGVVYILPETEPASALFSMNSDVAAGSGATAGTAGAP